MAEEHPDVGAVLSEIKEAGLDGVFGKDGTAEAPKGKEKPGIKPPKAKVERLGERSDEAELEQGYDGMFGSGPEEEKKEEAEDTKEAVEGKEPETPKTEVKDEKSEQKPEEKPKEEAKNLDDETFREVKVNGEVSKVSVSDLVRNYQLREASNLAFQKGKEAQKSAKDFYGQLMKNPRDAIIGILAANGENEERARERWYAYVEKQLDEYVEELKLSDEGRRVLAERRAVDREKRDLERKRAEIEAKTNGERQEALRAEIVSAMEASKLPKDNAIFRRIVSILNEQVEVGVDISIPEAVNRAKQEREEVLASYSKTLTKEEVLKLRPDLFKQESSKATALKPTAQTRSSQEVDGMFGGESESSDKRRPETPMSSYRVHKELLRRFKR